MSSSVKNTVSKTFRLTVYLVVFLLFDPFPVLGTLFHQILMAKCLELQINDRRQR